MRIQNPNDRPALTDRQAAILAFIRERSLEGLPPTSGEISAEFDFQTRAGAHQHLVALQKKGYIEISAGIARGIRLLDDASVVQERANRLPLIGVIAAGGPVLAAENITEWVAIGPGLFRPRADFLHRVAGSSMNRVVQDGDLIGIRLQSVAEPGQIIAAALPDRKIGGELITLKRYTRRGDVVVLKPDTTDARHRPIEIDLRGDAEGQERAPFRIVGILCSGFFRPGESL